ncbi:hypothetical protein SETIT_2G073900v2 [Setaria italica]|uniref:SHSP domain-containing protein n=1 Tax=Setaria italica TaxID=4555 RepID=A0A368PWJ1_SETIT|nr:uncharacterized protein LOC101773303 [Setaria italica]RCV09973.1 hypothetical protein SETIT_2G073900v2 [Setaria italica]
MHSSAIGCHHALAAAGRSAPAPPHTSLGARRHASASLPMSTKIGSSSNNNSSRRRLLVSRAAINIPPDALVNPKRIEHEQWGIGKGDKDEKVILWFVISGVEESEVQDEVEVNLPDGSNVLTIKRKKKNANEDELLDVRLLLTADYNTKGITVEGMKKEGKVRLEVTFLQNTSSIRNIDIK